jgi:hypothetical protein
MGASFPVLINYIYCYDFALHSQHLLDLLVFQAPVIFVMSVRM